MTGTHALYVHRVDVKRTPGIGDPFRLDALCDGVNLIYGPNGSGKTSTARAIEAVLWPRPEETRELIVLAHYQIAGATYAAELNAGRLAVQREGVDVEPPALPQPEFRERYRLSLHELLLASEHADRFAGEVARQSAGGYDFPAATKALGFASRPSTASKELQAFEEARRDLKAAQSQQAALHADAQWLDDLEQRVRAAGQAAETVRLMDAATAHMEFAEAACHAQALVLALPPGLEAVRGDEIARLDELDRRLAKASEAEAIERDHSSTAQHEADEALPNGIIARERILALAECASAFASAERSTHDATLRRDDTKAQAASKRQAVGPVLTDEQIRAVDGDSFGELAALSIEADGLLAAVSVADAEVRVASEGAGVTVPALDTVNLGSSHLVQWLRTPDNGSTRRTPAMRAAGWALVMLAVAGWALCAVIWHPASWVGVLIAVALSALHLRRPESEAGERAARQHDYAALGLEKPAAWTVGGVTEVIDRLQRLAADIRVAERRATWLAEARGRRTALDARAIALEAKRKVLVSRLGVAPGSDARQLAWIADTLLHWRAAWATYQGAEAALATALQQERAIRKAVEDAALAIGASPPQTSAEAVALAKGAELRVQEHTVARARAVEAQRRGILATAEREQVTSAITQLYDTCRCANGDAAALRALCERRPAYIEAVDTASRTKHECAAARRALESHSRFEPQLMSAPVTALAERRREAEELAREHETLVKQCAELRLRVNQAKEANDVEGCLAQLAIRQETLRACRARDIRALVGDALVAEVQRKTRDEHRPAVFRRARDLFGVMTSGRYRLEFGGEDEDGSSFRAFDTTTVRGQAMNELSSATRVQLLLAVRLAFVEVQEGDMRLPILLDEALGTSDEVRASAVVEAIIQLAKAGRQIFYFTAQIDEVVKWKSALAAHAVAHRSFDLDAIRNGGAGELADSPAVVVPPELAYRVPCIKGHDHESFGNVLQVPVIRPGAGLVEATPLWYLVDDLPALDQLLRRGVRTWGELENFVEAGGASMLVAYPFLLERARARAGLVAVLHQQSSIGRGGLVDRGALADSNAVSNHMLDAVTMVAARCGGDAARLLEALEKKEVKGFQGKKVTELREDLERRGYLDVQSPKAPTEIRVAMLGAMADDIAAGSLDETDVDRLLQRIQQRSSPSVGAPKDAMTTIFTTPPNDALLA
jgi:energy-coupling factor transporter ATP-binding protein EcfA2